MQLTLIGESINDSVPSTHGLFETGDIAAIRELAKSQEIGGAAYIDVNVGSRSPDFFATTVLQVQSAVSVPLSIDTPDFEMARVGLVRCDGSRGKPILNSISPLRTEMFSLYEDTPFRPILLISEQKTATGRSACQTAEQTYEAACFLRETAIPAGIPNEDMVFDPGIAPIGSDTEGHLRRILDTMAKIRNDGNFAGCHFSVGLSNFTVLLPAKRRDGSPVKGPLESAFLTIARPLGLDFIIGSVKRKYATLPPEHPAMVCLQECLNLSGLDVVKRVRDYYRK